MHGEREGFALGAFECLRQPPCARVRLADGRVVKRPFEWRGPVGPQGCPHCGHAYVDWLSFWCPFEDVWLALIDGPPSRGTLARRHP